MVKESIKLIIKAQKDQISENMFWGNLARALGLVNPDDLKNVWLQNFKKYSKLNKEVVTLIKKLNRKPYKVYLLSNTTKFYKNTSPYKKLLKDLFSVTVCSCDFKTRKPEKKFFDIVLSKLKINPKNCVFIDDQRNGLRYPKKLGMDTILFKSSKHLKSDLIRRNIL